jgi:SpoVK/Ycf46/Vps4 family AAA+-type ATPase
MTELTELIIDLEKNYKENSDLIRTVRYPKLLISSLKELNNVIGNTKVKQSIAEQIYCLLSTKKHIAEGIPISEDEVMLNTILSGPPGVGKTLIATKLAKIWYSLGFIKGAKNSAARGEFRDTLKGILKDNGLPQGGDEDVIMNVYMTIFGVAILISLMVMIYNFYRTYGPIFAGVVGGIIFLALLLIYYCTRGSSLDLAQEIEKNINNKNKISGKGESNNKGQNLKIEEQLRVDEKEGDVEPVHITDDSIVKIVSRADFVGKYVGWTDKRTNELLNNNIGKVLFVDEAYSLINGPHDEFGMEALTALNLFLSQHPTEIIVILAGYEDLIESSLFSVQPGLDRRFPNKFECEGYNAEELYRIFKLQLKEKGWGVLEENKVKEIFNKNEKAFPAYGGDTQNLTFLAKQQHNKEYMKKQGKMPLNMLSPEHIENAIVKLKEKNIRKPNKKSKNPLANMMKMMRGEEHGSAEAKSGDIDTDVLKKLQEKVQESLLNKMSA